MASAPITGRATAAKMVKTVIVVECVVPLLPLPEPAPLDEDGEVPVAEVEPVDEPLSGVSATERQKSF